MSHKIIMFSHIPKTAGTSLKFLLRRYFGTKQMDAIHNKNQKDSSYQPNDLKNEKWLYSRLGLVAGHCVKPHVDFKDLNNDLEWFTFLRKPTKRFISHYIHEQTNLNPNYKMDLIDWSKRYKRQNWSVRMIAGEENLNKAQDMLHEKFKFIGLTESFDESVLLMKNAFQLHGFDTSLKTNKMTIRDSGLKSYIHENYHIYEEIINENNILDNELYDYFIKNIWEDQKEKFKYFNENEIKINHNKNIKFGFLHRNLIYKPFANLKNQLR